MSVYLFTELFHLLLLLLLMCGTLFCGHVCTGSAGENDVPALVKTIELFKKDKIKDAKKLDGDELAVAEDVNVRDFYSPIIVSAGDYIVALAGINRIDETEKKINIVTNYTEKDKLLADGNVANINENWETQFVVHNEEIQKIQNAENFVKGLLAVAKDDKVYLLSVTCIKKKTDDSPDFDFAFYFFDSTVKAEKPKGIKWEKSQLTAVSVANKLKGEFNKGQLANFLFSGSAFLIDKEKVAFALVAKNLQKKFIALMQFKNDGQGEPEFVHTEIAGDCHPYVFPWDNKIMMISANCQTEANKKIMELSDIKGAWNDSAKAFSLHYKFLKNKKTFVTIKNDSFEILLFTEHIPETTAKPTKTSVNLWMSDGIRLKNIGEIVNGDEKVIPVGFLFADGKLFSLNQQLESGKEITSVTLKYLNDQSTEIISTINAWSTIDTEISNLCNDQRILKTFCVTDGLVGFLSGTKEEGSGDNKWKEKYLYEDATVTSPGSEDKRNAKKIDSGFKFSEGAGAKWPVGKGEQPYNFIDPGFTLLATVKVDDIAESNTINSVLGVVLKQLPGESTANNIRLLCNTEQKWVVYDTAKQTPLIKTTTGCLSGKTYSVALVLRSQKLEIYVDGTKLTFLESGEINISEQDKIDYFYFGAASEETQDTTPLKKTAVTITNVLLYNRPLDEKKEIEQLKPKQSVEENVQTGTGNDSSKKHNPGDDKTKIETETEPDTSNNKSEKDLHPSSPPPTTEDSAARVGVVGVLRFMLFGVFTLLGRYVY